MSECDKIIDKICKEVAGNGLTNDELISIINCTNDFLQPVSINDYCKLNKITYNGVLKRAKSKKSGIEIREFAGKKWVIDNK